METTREDDDVLARLESRLDSLAKTITQLRSRNAALEEELTAAQEGRDQAVAEVDDVREQMSRLAEENEAIRARQREAASRIKNLLTQVEQMDLLREG